MLYLVFLQEMIYPLDDLFVRQIVFPDLTPDFRDFHGKTEFLIVREAPNECHGHDPGFPVQGLADVVLEKLIGGRLTE